MKSNRETDPRIVTFRQTVGGSSKLLTYPLTLVVTVFLTIYNQVVCPFLESLNFMEELRNLIIANLFMLAVREILYRFFPRTKSGKTVARHGFVINVISWILAGLVGVALHEALYGDLFPWHSGLKILSGYWIMGAGIIAQIEYVIFERKLRTLSAPHETGNYFMEQIANRFTESTTLFVLMPVTAMIIMIVRYVFQEHLIPKDVALEITYLGVIFLFTAIVITIIYGSNLRKDARQIVRALGNIEKGNFNVNIDASRSDELGAMAYGINEMTRGLRQREKIREAFGRFVDPKIAQEFIDKHADEKGDVRTYSEKKDVAILMCDIRGFTAMSEKIDPDDVTKLLNRYFSYMVDIIQKEGGMVDKFVGDEIMAVFGIVGSTDPCIQAVIAASKMRRVLKDLNQELKKEGKPLIENGIGIHYGTVVAGYLGSQERLEYTVIGAPVNQSSRLCDAARSPLPPILFSTSVRDKIQDRVKDRFKIKEAGKVPLKGIGEVAVYTLVKSSNGQKV